MPRHYFHVIDGKSILSNHRGIELAGNAAARAHRELVCQNGLKRRGLK
jgi:hypothetical protein